MKEKWIEKQGRWVIIFVKPNSPVRKRLNSFVRKGDRYVEKIRRGLELNFNERIKIYFYHSLDEIERETGDRLSGWADIENCAVHVVHTAKGSAFDEHELTHIIVEKTIGKPTTKILSEGMAEAMCDTWWGYKQDEWAVFYLKREKLLLPSKIYETA
ncbi:MAG: hypothetical protein AB1393_14320 [Candidatus Edwardsbacteria bacterium]